MAKTLSKIEIAATSADLTHAQSAKRRGAAKKIGRHRLTSLGKRLHAAYRKEREDPRTWETQTEMIIALGKIGYKAAAPDLWFIVEANNPADTITYAAALSYVRLMRSGLHDAKPALKLLKMGKQCVLAGTTCALNYDDMVPPAAQITALIKTMESRDACDFASPGGADPRMYFISAMSKWPQVLTGAYLDKYEKVKDLRESVEYARKRKKRWFE